MQSLDLDTPSSVKQDFVDWVKQASENNGSFSQVSQNKIEEMYALAYVLYQHQRYQDARHFFCLLTETSPNEAKFWKGFGACLQMLKDYEGALNCYCCSAQFSKQIDPYLYVQTADCYFATKQVEAGLKALEIAGNIAKKADNKQVLQHVSFMKQIWATSKK